MKNRPAYLPVPKKEFKKHSRNYKGFPMKQSDSAPDIFRRFFIKERFSRVIELGTGSGGFTLFLGEQCGRKLSTFDVKDKLVVVKGIKPRLKNLGVSINVTNIFETDEVERLIKKSGRVLLLCDNGNKPLEVAKFSPMLKRKDVIMVHDYFRTAAVYYRQSTWRCCAFVDSYVMDKTLKPYYQDLFDKAFWMCRIKT